MMKSILLDHDEHTDPDWDMIEQGYPGPRTPSTISDNHHEPETGTRPQQYDSSEAGSDDDYGGAAQSGPKRKKGGYDSRIEQILYENPDLPILIVDAGKSLESGGKYIVYTIRTGVCLCDPCLELRANCLAGPGSATALLRICVSPRGSRTITPYLDNTPNSRETYNGRLCCESNKGKAGSTNH
jgi:hypothetical protein